jgi:hypothetical protein
MAVSGPAALNWGRFLDYTASRFERAKQMSIVQIQGYAGRPIHSFCDWEKYALPPDRKEQHWVEGRSAYELGFSWTANGEPAVPSELIQLLDTKEETRRIVMLSGITEHETRLPCSNGGPRCHDLALRARQDATDVTICIEAKADEPFGGTVEEELLKARKRVRSPDRVSRPAETRFPNRLDWLSRSLLGLSAFQDEQFTLLSDEVAKMPYQLLAAIGGTLIEAKLQNASKAIFVVHEFRTSKTRNAKMDHNAQMLNGFLRLLTSRNIEAGNELELATGHVVGPIFMTNRPPAGTFKVPSDLPLFIGKIRTDRFGISE